MGTFFKTESDLLEPKGRGWVGLLFWLVVLSAALMLVWRAPSLNNALFKNNKNMLPLTGTLWILVLPETREGGRTSSQKLLKIAEPDQPGAPAAPGMMYLSRFNDGLIRPLFFFNNLPQPGPDNRQTLRPFRYQIDDSREQRAMGVLQGRQILMLQPADGGFEDLGPELLARAARGRKLRVTLELEPYWTFEATYDVSEMGLALDQFKKSIEKDSPRP